MASQTDRIQLVLLGSIDLRDEASGSKPLAGLQPKRTALLAYLAMTGGPVRRDTLLALFWPELDDSQARRALNQAIFHLRRALGDDAIESAGMESVELRPEHVTCDAVEFERLAREGRLQEAMELYRGPFASGFHVNDLPNFERWMDGVRARIDAQAFAAASSLAASLAEGDPRTALQWARRAYEIDAGDAAARQVIALHDALGDRAGAIREYEQFARRVQQELGVDPSPETRRLAEEIRARAEPISAARSFTPSVSSTPPVAAHAVVPSAPIAPAAKPAARRRSWMVAGVIGAAVIAGIVALAKGQSNDTLSLYKDGQRELAAGRFESAVELFRRSVASDSTFAMGNYRLSVAANWTGQTGLANTAAARAQQLSAGLPEIDRQRIDAWVHYLRGETDEAERLYNAILAADPKDFDASFYLAEIQFHWGPMFGKPAEASAPAWDHVLALDASNAGAIIHRLRIAAMEFDSTTFDSLAHRLAGLNPSSDHQIEVRALEAFTFGDSAARAASTAEIASVEALRRSLVHEALLSARDMRSAARQLIPALFAGQTFPSFEQGEFLLGAQTSAATGHINEALATIDSAVSLQPDRALEYRAMMVTLPDVVPPPGARAAVRRALDEPLAPQSKYSSALPLRAYFRTILAVREGDLVTARRDLEHLSSLAPRAALVYDTTVSRHVDRLSRIASAEILRAEGKTDSALAVLGKPVTEPDMRIPYVWSYPRAEERFLRGDLLASQGKLKDALAWFSTFPDPGTYDLAYLPAALTRRLALAERLGDARSARIARARLASIGITSARAK